MALPTTGEHLRGLVDMGSNGIRFSITSLQPPTERIMPTLYQHRAGISLYDAQYTSTGERVPIDETTISAVLSSLQHFKKTCQDFGVSDANIKVLATEATRTALNSEEFRGRIHDTVGWSVTLLRKEDEGRIGALGVASSLSQMKGLMMDLGGGSTQLTWVIKKDSEGISLPPSGSVSMPYGAAAMTRLLAEAEKNGKVSELRDEITLAITNAYTSLKLPTNLEQQAHDQKGVTLYLSGGGFRGWGYLLMSQHRLDPYPIPMINGFKASRQEFLSIDQVKGAAAAALEDSDESVFRISDRRASQVPAVAFLVSVLAEALPAISEVRFCQGGVREGYLYESLPQETQEQYPLVVATQPFDAHASSDVIVGFLRSAIPQGASVFDADVLEAFANLIYYHSGYPKDAQTTAALRSTTSGILAGAHGVSHESRALLALLLCARWDGPIPPYDEAFKGQLQQLVDSPVTLWWINYVGAVARIIAHVYPAGNFRERDRLNFAVQWAQGKEGKSTLDVQLKVSKAVDMAVFAEAVRDIEKVGKKKRWIGGRDGIGFKVAVNVLQ